MAKLQSAKDQTRLLVIKLQIFQDRLLSILSMFLFHRAFPLHSIFCPKVITRDCLLYQIQGDCQIVLNGETFAMLIATDFVLFGRLHVKVLIDQVFVRKLFQVMSMDFLCLLKPLDAILAVQLAAIFVMLLGPTDFQQALLKVFVFLEFQSKAIMWLDAFNRRVHEPMNFAFIHQWVGDASLPRDLVSYQLTIFQERAPLTLSSIAPPRDLIESHQLVMDAAHLKAWVATMGVRALLYPKDFITYHRVVVGVNLQRVLAAVMYAKAMLWPKDSVIIHQQHEALAKLLAIKHAE